MTQSSIEWYEKEIKELRNTYGVQAISFEEFVKRYSEIFIKAKEKHKQEIVNAHIHNRCLEEQFFECSMNAIDSAEKYYTSTFQQSESIKNDLLEALKQSVEFIKR